MSDSGAFELGLPPATFETFADEHKSGVRASPHYLRLVREQQPTKRSECATIAKPCKWTSCRHNLAGKRDYATLEPDMSCSLDVAERGPMNQYETAAALGWSQQAVQQAEERALRKLARPSSKLKRLRGE